MCGDGVCADLVPPTFVEVTFNVDANAYNEQQGFVADTLYATGSFEQWSGFGVVLQNIGDGIYVGTTEIIEGTELSTSMLLAVGIILNQVPSLVQIVIGILMINGIIMVQLLLQT